MPQGIQRTGDHQQEQEFNRAFYPEGTPDRDDDKNTASSQNTPKPRRQKACRLSAELAQQRQYLAKIYTIITIKQ